MECHTNMDEISYHPVHLDGSGMQTKSIHNLNGLWIQQKSYNGQKPPADLPTWFDIHNCTNQETKQYSYWYHAKPEKQPPARLMYNYVAFTMPWKLTSIPW